MRTDFASEIDELKARVDAVRPLPRFLRTKEARTLMDALEAVELAQPFESVAERLGAERTGVVAALADLEIAVVTRGQLNPTVICESLRDQVDVRPLPRRRCLVHRADHRLVLVRAGDREHRGELCADQLRLVAHAAGDDHPPVLGDRLADRGQTFLLGRIEEAASVDQDHVGPGIVGTHRIAVGTQPGEDALAIDQRLGTAKADHPDARGLFDPGCHNRGGP